MKRSKAPVLTGVAIAMVMVVGLIVSLSMLIYPTQAGPAVLRSAVNVAATAQAIQTSHRQSQLEETRQAREARWNNESGAKEEALATFEQETLAETEQLRLELEEVQSQIDQVQLNIQETQRRILAVRQAMAEEEVNHQQNLASLEQEMSQAENELRTELELTQAALDTARAELANFGAAATSEDAAGNGETNPLDAGSFDEESEEDDQEEDRAENDDKAEEEDPPEDENEDDGDRNDDDHNDDGEKDGKDDHSDED